MGLITTTLGDIDESLLRKVEGDVDNENEHTTTVEYCLNTCDGMAHIRGTPDSEVFFCSKHIHRSAHVRLKKNVSTFGEVQGF
jgi:hypothetical protein